MKDAQSYLKTKKIVNMHPFPLPFSIHEGMVETIYCVANSIAMTSVCSPGLYRTLIDYISILPGKKKLVLDDILGLAAPRDNISYAVWTLEYINLLRSYGRITWRTPHELFNATEYSFERNNWDVVVNATPLHYLHRNRLDFMGAVQINRFTNTFFIIPAGTADKTAIVSAYARMFILREAYLMRIPSAIIDDHFVLVPPQGVKPPQIDGAYVQPLDTSLPVVKTDGVPKQNEEGIFTALYG